MLQNVTGQRKKDTPFFDMVYGKFWISWVGVNVKFTTLKLVIF